jgi:phosphoribosyl-ATP pyrophosphohydrolase/phosphoribosyl-AMP cyclohydrolase
MSGDTPTPPVGELRAAILQEAETGRVLTLAWMDERALARTAASGEVHLYSRSRQAPWHKGETSGNVLHVESLQDDCDGDAIVVQVTRTGPACHTGSVSCFAPRVWRTISERAATRPEGSYVTHLLEGGTAACAQKVGEEAVETALAAVGGDDAHLVSEVADLVFHTYVLLAARGLEPADVEAELARREGAPRRHVAAPAGTGTTD